MTRTNLDFDSLYESISEEFPISPEVFRGHLNDLVTIGLVERNINELNDEVWYTEKHGLHFAEFSAIDDPLKKQILLQFISCPSMFFVLFNTQKGKSRITIQKIISWTKDTRRIVPIVMLESNIGLGDQTVQGIVKQMGLEGVPVELFQLVSTCAIPVLSILTYIDSWVGYPEENRPMPLIVALSNDKQLAKVLEILNHISKRHTRHPTLAYGMIWDEADKTYPAMRNKEMTVDGKDLCIRNFMLDVNALGGCGWITATEGNLLDEFPECANAYAMLTELNAEDEIHYRAFHHPEAIVKTVKMGKKNNESFLAVFHKNPSHFMKQHSGYRKTIVNCSIKTTEHTILAKQLNDARCHAMTFNQTGLTIYPLDSSKVRLKTKGRSFNELLFYAYKKCNLHTAPLFILGRRKVDRGLSFHYAPRSYRGIESKTMEFELGPLVTDGIEGLIWTDMFLGHVEIKESAVQKAGRLAGIIAHCPQYCSVTWWTDEETAIEVKHHYEKVDNLNHQVGCNTMVQAIAKAEREVPVPKEREPTIRTFKTQEEAKAYYHTHLKAKFGSNTRGPNTRKPDEHGFYLSTSNRMTKVRTTDEILEIRKWALNEGHHYTFHPCYKDPTNQDTLEWWLIYYE